MKNFLFLLQIVLDLLEISLAKLGSLSLIPDKQKDTTEQKMSRLQYLQLLLALQTCE